MITALLKENDELTHTQIHQRQMILKMHAHRNTETSNFSFFLIILQICIFANRFRNTNHTHVVNHSLSLHKDFGIDVIV